MKRTIVVLLTIGLLAGLWLTQERAVTKLAYQWPLDKALVYHVHYQSQGEGAFSVALSANKQTPSDKKKINIDVEGTLTLSFVEKQAQSLVFNVRFSDSDISSQIGSQLNFITPLQAALEFGLVIEKNGEISSIKMTEKAYDIYGDLFRDIFSLVELPLSELALAQWQAQEKKLPVSYPVTLALLGKRWFSNTWNIEKRYGKVSQASVSGPIRYEFDNQQGILTKVSGERKRVFSLGAQELSRDKTTILLAFESFASIDSSSKSAPWIVSQSVVEDSLTGEEKRIRMQKRSKVELLGGRDIHQVKSEFDKVDISDAQQITQLSRQLVALMTLEPKQAHAISQWLFEFDVSDDRFGAVASALTYVGSDEAQLALIHVMEQLTVGDGKQLTLMGNLAFVETPSLASEGYFREMLHYSDDKNIFSKANLALGIIANKLSESDKTRQLKLFTELEQQLLSSRSERDDRIFINAIGNIGVPEQVPLIKKYVEDKSHHVSIRKEAVVALRFVESIEAEETLLGYLVDKDEQIRLAAAEALSYSPGSVTTLEAYQRQLFEESNVSALKHMLGHLSDMSLEYPESIALLDDFISQCGHPDLCDYARNLKLTRK